MGCSGAREKIEDKMMILKLERMEIKMEKEKELSKLSEMVGHKIKPGKIPDYIDPKFAKEKKIYDEDDDEFYNNDKKLKKLIIITIIKIKKEQKRIKIKKNQKKRIRMIKKRIKEKKIKKIKRKNKKYNLKQYFFISQSIII